MKAFIAPIVVGMLVLASVLPATAQSKNASDQGASVHLATTSDAAAERNSYTQRAQGEMRVWQQKLQDFDTRTKAKTTDAKARASKDLDNAWTDAKDASARLETAAEKDWDSAKASFKTASHKLAVAWQKINPTGK